jgi:hypothetical protein
MIAYLQIGRKRNGSFKVKASSKPSHALVDGLPTVSFALDIVIPDEAFRHAETVIARISPNVTINGGIEIELTDNQS